MDELSLFITTWELNLVLWVWGWDVFWFNNWEWEGETECAGTLIVCDLIRSIYLCRLYLLLVKSYFW